MLRRAAQAAARPLGVETLEYRLGQNVTFCRAAGASIFLDLSSGRYVGLPTGIQAAFDRYLSGEPLDNLDQSRLQFLVDRGLLRPTEDGAGDPVRPLNCTSQVQENLGGSGRTNVSEFLVAAASRIYAYRYVRRTSLSVIAQGIGQRRLGLPHDSAFEETSTYLSVISAVNRTRAIIDSTDRCLPDSLAFLWLCFRRGLRPSLVIGVRPAPFSAHCWVQKDSIVLSDTVENTRLYTPILIL